MKFKANFFSNFDCHSTECANVETCPKDTLLYIVLGDFDESDYILVVIEIS